MSLVFSINFFGGGGILPRHLTNQCDRIYVLIQMSWDFLYATAALIRIIVSQRDIFFFKKKTVGVM